MAISKVVSIEITDSVTRVCELSYGKKIVTVYNAVMFDNPENSVEDAVVVEDSEYVSELKKHLKEAKIKCKDAVFVLTSNRILSREISIPDMKEKLIADYIEGEKTQYFPMDISEHKLTYCIADKDEQKKELKLIVYAAPYELIRSYQTLAKALDVKIVKLDYIGNTEYKHLQVNNSNSKLDFYIEINESNTLFTILENGKYALQRNMNFGALQLVRHLMDEGYYGPIDAKEAMTKLVSENLIFGSYSEMAEYSPSDEADAKLYECRKRITDAVRPLISSVARVLEYYNNRNKDVSIGEIYAGGCGSQVKGILELITSEFEGVRFKRLAKLPGIKYSKANDLMVNRSTEFMSCIGASHISGIDFNIIEVSA
ncbi:MAG: pilus assembly protein PilM, partial [Lachnospiraceae bacterium]|nr:pilus assembly protein PilM [Lachnospiraceae bacterium]